MPPPQAPAPHLQTALIVFISHCVVAGSAHCLSVHGSEICMQWVFQHASHISSFSVSQAHFVPANPTHQSAVPHSQVTHRCLCPLLPVPDLKGRGETPHLSDKISAHWLRLSAHISPTALCSLLILSSLDSHLAQLRSHPHSFLSTPVLKRQLSIFASGSGVDLQGDI